MHARVLVRVFAFDVPIPFLNVCWYMYLPSTYLSPSSTQRQYTGGREFYFLARDTYVIPWFAHRLIHTVPATALPLIVAGMQPSQI